MVQNDGILLLVSTVVVEVNSLDATKALPLNIMPGRRRVNESVVWVELT